MRKPNHAVRSDGGKYTFVSTPVGIRIDRGGEPWIHLANGQKAVHSMMCEIDAARVVITAARELASRGEAPPALLDALQAHEALVGDREKPSEWTGVKS